MVISDIYKVEYMRNRISYIGLLRNEKKFNINDNVFFAYGEKIFRGKIVGVELLPAENPEYKYKVQLSEDLMPIRYTQPESVKPVEYGNLICDDIFNTVEEAKQSAIDQLNKMTELQRKEIERYFKQFGL
jgi:uncharacterized protein YuzE